MVDDEKQQLEQGETFAGFPPPLSNFCKVPNALFDAFPKFTSKSELMVVMYVLRHTWGYQEFDSAKRITVDEFMNGRKRKDGARLDNGIGMSAPAVRRGIEKAVAHGFLEVEVDDSDKARIEKYYMLKMAGVTKRSITPESGVTNDSPEVTKDSASGNETSPRTEKDTLERNQKKDTARDAVEETPPPLSDETLAKIAALSGVERKVAEVYAKSRLELPDLDELCHAVEKYGAPIVLEAIRIADDQTDEGKRRYEYMLGIAARLQKDGWKPPEQETPRPRLKAFKPAADDEVIDFEERKRLADVAAANKSAVLGAASD